MFVRPSRRPRTLAVALAVVGGACIILAFAYVAFARAQLPAFLPHGGAAPRGGDSHDLAMGLVVLFPAALALSGARYAQAHRSWVRSRRWHRRHGRI
jgi:hypothetical protein